VVGKNGKFGYINKEDVQITPLKYDEAIGFLWKWGEVRTGDKWGLVNTEGKEITPLMCDEIYGNEDPIVKLNGKYGFVG
jgi:hypothetical protein